MTTLTEKKNELWHKQHNALRGPEEILGGNFQQDGISQKTLEFRVDDAFIDILDKLKLTLFVTREYEQLVVALTVRQGKLLQSFVHLPHPAGVTADRENNRLYIAATRNPNMIWEFSVASGSIERTDRGRLVNAAKLLLPARAKIFAGAYYFHDLATINGELYANSVGQNAVIKVDFANPKPDKPVWWPKAAEDKNGKLDARANYMQLNSIAAGKTLVDSFFSASSDSIGRRRPGHLDFKVDKNGVIFSGKTRNVFARGLTRPHSAQLYKNELWVDNSGYGEIGRIIDGTFEPLTKLPGWTRGLCVLNDYLIVGVSRIIPKFRVYAPGLKISDQKCGLYIVDKKTGRIVGTLLWPYGNQLFAIDWLPNKVTLGFPFTNVGKTPKNVLDTFYAYVV